MTTNTEVKYFDSTMSGAPSLSGTAGTLISVLDACLVNGFGSVTLNPLVVASNVATATVSTGHGFAMVGSTGPVIRIEGATPAGLNGDWRIQSVPSSTQFTFTTTGISDQTATGTITAKRAPAGFSKAFSGTDKAAYQANSLQSTRMFMRIDDTGTTTARLRGYEAMSDVDTGTGLFPTDAQISGGVWTLKSNAASTASRPWTLFSDGRMIYFFIEANNNAAWQGGFVFGDIIPVLSADAYHCLLIAQEASTGAMRLYTVGTTTASYFPRAYTQIGSSVLSARYSHRLCTTVGHGGYTYPAVIGNELQLWPIECSEPNGIRGTLPGIWCPVHDGITHGTMFNDIAQLPNRDFIVQVNTTSGCMVMDLTGPWR